MMKPSAEKFLIQVHGEFIQSNANILKWLPLFTCPEMQSFRIAWFFPKVGQNSYMLKLCLLFSLEKSLLEAFLFTAWKFVGLSSLMNINQKIL